MTQEYQHLPPCKILLHYWCFPDVDLGQLYDIQDIFPYLPECISGISFSPVCVVDKCIEALVEPLPENNGRCGFVESHHATRYQHVERNLLKIISSVKT